MRQAVAAALIMSLPLSAAIADVYRSVDSQGHVQYSDTPTPGAELVHVQKLGSFGSTSSTAPASSISPAKSATKGGDPVQDTIDRQIAQRAVQQDEAQTRADQCKKATEDYNRSIEARRIYKTGADGEREYMTDADADQMRLNLRLAMQTACGS